MQDYYSLISLGYKKSCKYMYVMLPATVNSGLEGMGFPIFIC